MEIGTDSFQTFNDALPVFRELEQLYTSRKQTKPREFIFSRWTEVGILTSKAINKIKNEYMSVEKNDYGCVQRNGKIIKKIKRKKNLFSNRIGKQRVNKKEIVFIKNKKERKMI